MATPSSNVRVYVAVLYLKFLVTTIIQGGKTFESGGRPPEDNKLSSAKGHPKQNYGVFASSTDEKANEKVLKAREVENRWRRIIANDLESLPFALLIFVGGVLANANELIFAGAMVSYTLARCAHTYVYAKQMQPHRSLFWFIAVLSILVGAGNAIVAAYL